MSAHRRWAGVLTAVVLAATTTGCGSSGGKAAHMRTSTESYDVLLRRASGYAEQTLRSVFGAGANLEPLEGANPVVASCSDEPDPPRGTPVDAQSDFRVLGAEPARIATYAAAFEKHWGEAGWTHRDGTVADGGTTMASADGFTLVLGFAADTDLVSLSVTTPCVAPKDADHPLGDAHRKGE